MFSFLLKLLLGTSPERKLQQEREICILGRAEMLGLVFGRTAATMRSDGTYFPEGYGVSRPGTSMTVYCADLDEAERMVEEMGLDPLYLPELRDIPELFLSPRKPGWSLEAAQSFLDGP